MQTLQNQQDNRAPGVRRVALDTLVELCGQETDTPAFEGRSLNVSGRGMLVESDFVPAVKTPLVMRFEHEGREVVVEGLVAWRDTSKSGGRFGVRFTALDSKSVVVLKALCGQEQADEDCDTDDETPSKQSSPLFAELEQSETPQPVFTTTVGAPMKLHIDGLAAPMKARVVDGKPAKLRVGSQLDFLRLGRPVQVEDLSLGLKRDAHVHTVDVQVDAGSGIPQLVVTLKWEGCEDVTPAPTVVPSSKRKRALGDENLTESAFTPAPRRNTHPQPTMSSRPLDDEFEASAEDDDDDFNTAEALLKSRVALWATALSRNIKSASEQVAGASRGTTRVVGGWLKRSSESRAVSSRTAPVRSTRSLRPEPAPSRDRGSRHPSAAQSRSSVRPASKKATVSLKRSHVAAAGAATLCVALGLYFFAAGAPKESAQVTPPGAASETSRAPAQVEMPGVPLPAAGAANMASRRQPLDTDQQLRADTHGMVANVPLFGPTQMATSEAAPDADESVAVIAPSKRGVDEVSLAKDESFSDKVVAEPSEQASQRVFQVGRMNLPVIHRLRLDAPAELLQGEKTPNGFSILVPGRKVMESGAGIAGRDERITQVSAKNTPAGARITFRFGKDVPGYKARLRNDYVEFFINSP